MSLGLILLMSQLFSLINVAAFFAMRFKSLNDPAVFRVAVPNETILARVADRDESEYFLRLPLPAKPRRIPKHQMNEAYQAYMKDRDLSNGKIIVPV